MAALKSNSPFLNTITDDFRQMLEDFQIISFYETRPLGSFGVVSVTTLVDYESRVNLTLALGCRSQVGVAWAPGNARASNTARC